MRLNRTSVGLKRRAGFAVRPSLLAPQSNQRGIETFTSSDEAWEIIEPQSNQRGIETPYGAGDILIRSG